MTTVVRGGTVLTPGRTLAGHEVVLEGTRIAEVRPARTGPATGEVVDAAGGWIVPGFVDVHVHGGGGHDVMDATPQALEALSSTLARHGVTSFLATTVTAERARTTAALATVAAAAESLAGARLLGTHLEGPYLAAAHRGAQNKDELRLPDLPEYAEWFDTGTVRLVTLAPELDGALELIASGTAKGVRFSAGHSGASETELHAALDAGLRHATHAFNGMPSLHHRQPGLLGAILTDDRVRAELIADGVHVHPTVMDLLVRVKGPERVMLVSDAMRAAGMPDGTYELGGQRVTMQAGVCRTTEGGLAGSTLTLDRAVRNLVHRVGVAWGDAVTMATASPADALDRGDDLGRLAVGHRADVTVLDAQGHVRTTIVDGRIVHSRQEGPEYEPARL